MIQMDNLPLDETSKYSQMNSIGIPWFRPMDPGKPSECWRVAVGHPQRAARPGIQKSQVFAQLLGKMIINCQIYQQLWNMIKYDTKN